MRAKEMRLDTEKAKAKIAKFMLSLYDKEFGPYAIKNNLWFHNQHMQIWLSPRQMREQIAKGACDLSKLHLWEYVGPNNLSKHAKDKIQYWSRVEYEAKEEEAKTTI